MLALAGIGKSLESVPADLIAAVETDRVPVSILHKYLELEKSVFFRWLLQFGGFRERLLADDLFLAKVSFECCVGVFTKSASDLLGCLPDIACYTKLMTGGVIPLAATLATDVVFDAFKGDSKLMALLHGHSYSAHAMGCTAAAKAIQSFKDPVTNINISTDGKRLREREVGYSSQSQQMQDAAVTHTSSKPTAVPDFDSKCLPCLVKVYDSVEPDVKMNDIIEFIGVFTFDPELAVQTDGSDDLSNELHDDALVHLPPNKRSMINDEHQSLWSISYFSLF